MKYKYFKNITPKSADFYVYGTIVDEKEPDFWTGEVSTTEVDTNDMKNELDELQKNGIKDLNIYINSPGGSVFASSTIVSLLKRFRTNTGAKIHSYVDGLCASAATYLCMVADDINIYQNSIMMIHKPMSIAWGNANDFQKEIDTLNTIENDMMVPMYMSKSTKSEDELKRLINEETWFSGNENDVLFIGNYFDVNYLEESKQVAACTSKDLFKNYKHIPKELVNEQVQEQKPKQQEVVEETQKIDYSTFEDILISIKEERK